MTVNLKIFAYVEMSAAQSFAIAWLLSKHLAQHSVKATEEQDRYAEDEVEPPLHTHSPSTANNFVRLYQEAILKKCS